MSTRYDDDRREREDRLGPSWAKWFAGILSVLLLFTVGSGVAIYLFADNLIGRMQDVSDEEVKVVKVEDLPQEAIDIISTEEAKGAIVDDKALNDIHEQMTKIESTVQTKVADDVYNVLLVGVDRRDKSWNGNSDSMMLVSVNYTEKRIRLVSLMRDTYVEIDSDDGSYYAKLNNAYAVGGGPLLCKTISDSFRIDVTKYASVDFENMIKIIDAIGGVDLTMTEDEVNIANGYMYDMCNTLGIDYAPYLLVGGGTYHCSGVQAVAFARNRFVGNSDYARTGRQRYVISQIINSVKTASVSQLYNFAREILPLVLTNIPSSEVWDLIGKAPELIKYDYQADRIPYDDAYSVIYVNGQDMLVPDWTTTISRLHDTIYGDGKISSNSDNKV